MSTPSTDRLLDVVASTDLGTLATIKRDGRPQLSDIRYAYDRDSGTIRVSITDSRAKTKNIRRDPRVSLHVSNTDGWGYAVVEGTGHLTPTAIAPDDATVDALVTLYRDLAGEHPDWDEYRAAMVEQGRLVLTIDVERAYGAL